ncbi:hypothetical protein AZF37_04465 [endosymbiont 'TC1' of Trimyema compressum]|nr:hypothetical protein AZF37_04465 [endosymbiont 'TC1' of Trimyema compressum]
MTILDLEKLIGESIENNFFSICIPPMYVSKGREMLKNIPVKTITVVAFPLGYKNLKSKAVETYQCLTDGAEEIDIVANIPHLKNRNFIAYQEEIESIKKVCQSIPLKVII